MALSDFQHVFVEGNPGAPVFLLLHGTGGSEHDLMDLGAAIAPSFGRLGVRGQVDENGNARFFRRLAEGVFDELDLVMRTQQLAQWIEEARAELLGDRPLVALGYSNGANMAGSLLLHGVGGLAGAILLRPMVPLRPPVTNPIENTAILILSGRDDWMCPPSEGERLAEMLRRQDAEVETKMILAGHNLTNLDVTAAQKFVAVHWPPTAPMQNFAL